MGGKVNCPRDGKRVGVFSSLLGLGVGLNVVGNVNGLIDDEVFDKVPFVALAVGANDGEDEGSCKQAQHAVGAEDGWDDG